MVIPLSWCLGLFWHLGLSHLCFFKSAPAHSGATFYTREQFCAHAYLHSKDSQLLRGQLFHLIGQNLSFLQDGKLRLGCTISTRESRANKNEAPRKSQEAPVKPGVVNPESSARIRRQNQTLLACPPRHDGCESTGCRNAESQRLAEKKKSRETTFTTLLQRRVRAPFLSGKSLQHFQQRKPAQFLEIPREKKVDPSVKEKEKKKRWLLFFKTVGVPSSASRSNSWKSGKVCESRRFTTMGVKVGGVETQRVLPAPGSSDQWIRVCAAFSCPWENGVPVQEPAYTPHPPKKQDTGKPYFGQHTGFYMARTVTLATARGFRIYWEFPENEQDHLMHLKCLLQPFKGTVRAWLFFKKVTYLHLCLIL